MEGQGRSRKVKEGHGRSFPIARLTFQVRKVMSGGGEWRPVGLSCQPQSQSLSLGLWIWDFGLGLGLDNIVIWHIWVSATAPVSTSFL